RIPPLSLAAHPARKVVKLGLLDPSSRTTHHAPPTTRSPGMSLALSVVTMRVMVNSSLSAQGDLALREISISCRIGELTSVILDARSNQHDCATCCYRLLGEIDLSWMRMTSHQPLERQGSPRIRRGVLHVQVHERHASDRWSGHRVFRGVCHAGLGHLWRRRL